MGKLSRIYTKTGDDGTSGLVGGTRVPKYDPRLEAYGTVDELNSWIGLIRAQNIGQHEKNILADIQNKLLNIGSRLATDTAKMDLSEKVPCKEEDIRILENEMDKMNEVLPPLNNFVLPGGDNISSYCHLARTVCRRAERRAYEMARNFDIPKEALWYLNRLSDYLFVLSRKISGESGIDEIYWQP